MLGVPSDIVWPPSCPHRRSRYERTSSSTVKMSPWRRSTTLRARRASSSASIVDRSSSPDEGAADGQHRQDPTDQPADAWRTSRHVDSGRRFRCFDRGGGGDVGDDGPPVRIWPIRRQLRKCHDREFDGQRSRARMWCRSTRLVSRCLYPARRPLESSPGAVSNRGDSAIADNAGKLARPVASSILSEAVDPRLPLKRYGCSWVRPRKRFRANQFGGPRCWMAGCTNMDFDVISRNSRMESVSSH
jgi:hypothetical protein